MVIPTISRRLFLQTFITYNIWTTIYGCHSPADVPDYKLSYPLLHPVSTAPKILIAGGLFHRDFIGYLAALTGKDYPKVCYLATATGDRQEVISNWYKRCRHLQVDPYHQESFIASASMPYSWADALLTMDAIVVSGGNTLNQLAIWKAQGIDQVLYEAWQKGIVLGGASAGSLCWFEEGLTDSRPQELSVLQGLGFLHGSHTPHYNNQEDQRREKYLQAIKNKELKAGWACDDGAGIYFEGTNAVEFLASQLKAYVYYVEQDQSSIQEIKYTPKMIRAVKV